jgi:hypothetical protein
MTDRNIGLAEPMDKKRQASGSIDPRGRPSPRQTVIVSGVVGF